jgi:hypothetical protein
MFIAVFQQDYLFCIYFILIGFVLTFFHKNMIVVLVLAISFANILRMTSGNAREGLENKDTPVKEGADETLQYSDVKAEEKTAPAKPAAVAESKGDKTKNDMVETIKKDADKLIDTQNKIIGGFEKIDPYMKQAEQLIQNIDSTAKKIEGMNRDKVEQYKNKS